jgi:hypothetical protein
MNDKLNRFTQQLGDNAPLAPDLENQTFAVATEGRGSATGLRVGIALGVVAALAVGLVVANRENSPTAVVSANEQSAVGEALISSTVASVLPEGFSVSSVERPQEPQLNITVASTDGVVLLIKATLTASADTEITTPATSPVIDGTEIPAATMAPGSVRHLTVLTNSGDTIQIIADALSVGVSQLAELYGWSETYVFDSSIYVGWVDPIAVSDNCLVAPCLRYLSDRTTVESVATELGIPPQALASYNGFGLDHPVASNFPVVLPTIEETMSMTGVSTGRGPDSTLPESVTINSADSDGLSVFIQRYALNDWVLDESLSTSIQEALLALNTPERSLQSIVDSIILKPSYSGVASFREAGAFQSLELTQADSFVDGSFSLLIFAAADGSSARGLTICLPVTAIADSVTTDDNGIIVAIRSNETTTCIVWLVDARSIGATEADVAALATEGLSLAPSEEDVTETTAIPPAPVITEAPVDPEVPVDTEAPASPDSTVPAP